MEENLNDSPKVWFNKHLGHEKYHSLENHIDEELGETVLLVMWVCMDCGEIFYSDKILPEKPVI